MLPSNKPTDMADDADVDAEEIAVELEGELGSITSTITSAWVSPAFATGRSRTDGRLVLVPLMTCQLEGTFGRDDEAAKPSVTLAFDNVAYLFMQLSEEYVEALELLDAVSTGGLGPISQRFDYAHHWLSVAASNLERAALNLDERWSHLASDVTEADA